MAQRGPWTAGTAVPLLPTQAPRRTAGRAVRSARLVRVDNPAVLGDAEFVLGIADAAGLFRDPGDAAAFEVRLGRRLHGNALVGVFAALFARMRFRDALRAALGDFLLQIILPTSSGRPSQQA